MAGTNRDVKDTSKGDDSARAVQEELNKVIDDLEVLRAGLDALAAQFNAALTKLDADAGVTDTDYNATHAVTVTTYDAAADMTAAKVNP